MLVTQSTEFGSEFEILLVVIENAFIDFIKFGD